MRRGDIETGGLRLLLLRLLVELVLELLRNSRNGRGRASLEGLLLRKTGLEGLLLGSGLAGKASELGLKLGSLRLRLLNARIARVLILKRRRLPKTRGLGSEGARLLLLRLAWLLSRLTKRVTELLLARPEAIATT